MYTEPLRKAPSVIEAHGTDVLEDMRREALTQAQQAELAARALGEKTRENDVLVREVHAVRKAAASEKKAFNDATKDNELIIREKRLLEQRLSRSDTGMQKLQERFDVAMDELNFVKEQLSKAREERDTIQSHFDGVSGSRAGLEALTRAETLAAENAELTQQLTQRDSLVDSLSQTVETLQKEKEKLIHDVRHEQQRYQVLLSDRESSRVLLDTSKSELQHLRCQNKSLTEDVHRLTNQNNHLFTKLKDEMESIHVRELSLQGAFDNNHAAAEAAGRVNLSLETEQSINKALQEENTNLRQNLANLNEQVESMKKQLENLRTAAKHIESTFERRAADLKFNVEGWTSMQAHECALSKAQATRAESVLAAMKNDIDAMKQVVETTCEIPSGSAQTRLQTPRLKNESIDRNETTRQKATSIEDDVKSVLQQEIAARQAAQEAREAAERALGS